MKIKNLSLIAALAIPFITIAGGESVEIGAKSDGLAGATATLSDVWAAQNNQAGLATLKNVEAGFYYNTRILQTDEKLIGLVAAIPTAKGVFGLGVTNAGLSGAFTETKIALSFAKALSDKFNAAAGIDVLMFNQGRGLGNSTNFTVELGFQYIFTDKLSIGGHVYNPVRTVLTEDINRTPGGAELIPTQLKLGLAYKFSEKVNVLIEADKNDQLTKAQFAAALDYMYNDNFFIRMGVSTNETKNAFGIGYKKEGLKFDIGAQYQSRLGIFPTISLSYELK
jgi:hypothetical protein